MRAIAKSKDAHASRITECWGFDNFYGGEAETNDWLAWAEADSTRRLVSFYLKGDPKVNAERLQKRADKKPLSNIETFVTTAAHHFDIPRTHWRSLIGRAGFEIRP